MVTRFLQIDSPTLKYIYHHSSFLPFLNRSFGSHPLKKKHNREWKSLKRAIMNICTRECGNKVLNQCKSCTNCWMALKFIEHFCIFNIWKFEYPEMQEYITSGILFVNCKSSKRSLRVYRSSKRSFILNSISRHDSKIATAKANTRVKRYAILALKLQNMLSKLFRARNCI